MPAQPTAPGTPAPAGAPSQPSTPRPDGNVTGTAARAVPLARLLARQAARLWVNKEQEAPSDEEGDSNNA
jgi:hypothetical protein